MAFFRNQMFNRQPMGFAPRQSRFSGGLGGLFGGMGGFNPYQQQMPRMGGMMGRRFSPMMGRRFNPMMGGGFNPMMGGGFNPYMGAGFNPMMGGGFNPYMGGGFAPMMGGFQGYDFNTPIGEAPPGVEPTPPPPPPSISDLYGGLDEAQRNAFLEQYGLAPTPPPPAPIERPDVDERDMFDSGSVPGEPRMGTMGGSGFGRFPLGTAGPEFLYDDAGNPILEPPEGLRTGFTIDGAGSTRPIPPEDFGFGPGIRPTEIIGPDGSFIGSGSVTPPQDRATAIPQPDPEFDIPGVDLEKIRESLAKMEPIIPGISLPEPIRISEPAPTPRPIPTPRPVPVRGPGRPTLEPIRGVGGGKFNPMPPPQAPVPMPALPVNPFDNPLFSDPGLGSEGGGRPMPLPMPVKAPMPVKGPQPYKNIPIKVSPPVKAPMPVKGPQPYKNIPIKVSPTVIPAPRPVPVKGPGRIRVADPIKVRPPGKIAPLPIKRSPPPVKVPMPMPSPVMPMPSPVMPSPIIPGPLPRVISDPVMPKPAPITRGIGGVRGGMRGRRR